MRETRETRFGDFFSEEDGQNTDTNKQIIVDPGTGRAVSLGRYPANQPEPDFDISFKPDMEEEMGIAMSRLDMSESDDDRQYILMLQLHNFGSEPCTVTVRRPEK